MSDKLRGRVWDYMNTGQILDTAFGFTIKDFFSKNDIILNLMDEKSEYLTKSLVINLLTTLQEFHSKKPKSKCGLKTIVVIDECRSIFPVKSKHNDFEEDIFLEKFKTTKRANEISLIALTQEPQSVADWLTSNNAFYFAFPLIGNGRAVLKDHIGLTNTQLASIEKLPKYGTAIVSDERFDRKFLLQVPNDLSLGHISKDETNLIMRKFIFDMHETINKRCEKFKPKKRTTLPIPEASFRILKAIQRNWNSPKTELLKRTHLGSKRFNQYIIQLLANEYVAKVKCKTSAKKSSEFYALENKAHEILKTPRNKMTPGPRLFKHTYYQYKVAEHLKKKGLKPKIEYKDVFLDDFMKSKTKTGKPVQIPLRIDVAAEMKNRKMIGYEVTLSFKNLALNIHKCFIKMNMEKVVIVCETQDDCGTAKRRIGNCDWIQTLLDNKGQDIEFKQISDFL